MLLTGCRPKEAAYITFYKSLQPNSYIVKHLEFTKMATVPASSIKTKEDYFWLLLASSKKIVDAICSLPKTGFSSMAALRSSLTAYYRKQVLKKLDVQVYCTNNRTYAMRSIRCHHAVEWVKLVDEYRLMGWSPEPSKPLQHETEKLHSSITLLKVSGIVFRSSRGAFRSTLIMPKSARNE